MYYSFMISRCFFCYLRSCQFVNFKETSSSIIFFLFHNTKTYVDKWSVIMCEQHRRFYTHVFLEKWINFQKFCSSFWLSKRNVVLNILFLCRVFITEYRWKHRFDVWSIFLTFEKIDIFIEVCYVVFLLSE